MLDPEAPDERRDQIASEARRRIESSGSLKAEKAWGMRKLAYEIRQRTEADYRFFRFETESPLLDELNHNLKITDGVLRFRIFKVDPESPGDRAAAAGLAGELGAEPRPRRPPRPRPRARRPRRPRARARRPRRRRPPRRARPGAAARRSPPPRSRPPRPGEQPAAAQAPPPAAEPAPPAEAAPAPRPRVRAAGRVKPQLPPFPAPGGRERADPRLRLGTDQTNSRED